MFVCLFCFSVVKSFGTEDRVKPGDQDGRNPVPPNPNLFEFIIFSASDIKVRICLVAF